MDAQKSNFQFVEDAVSRRNLDNVFSHILVLLTFVESDSYNESAKSSFRKTIIIHTASVVEAMLFYLLDKKFSNDDIAKFYSEWKLINSKDIYIISSTHKIVSGEYIKRSSNVKKAKMNLGQIMIFLQDNSIVNEDLFEKLDIIRKLRNEQHLGTHKNVKMYSRDDLEMAFGIASEVKSFVQNIG